MRKAIEEAEKNMAYRWFLNKHLTSQSSEKL